MICKQTRQTSRSFLVFGDLVATYLFAVLMGCANCLLLLGYWLIWRKFSGMKAFEFISMVAGVCIVSLALGEKVFVTGRQTPHLRTTAADLRRYMVQFVIVLLIACSLTIAMHIIVSAIAVPILSHSQFESDFTHELFLAGLFGILELCIFHGLTYRTFIHLPMPTEPRELIRGQDLESGDDVEWRAWRDR